MRRAAPEDLPAILGLYRTLSSTSMRMRFGRVLTDEGLAEATAWDGDPVVLVAVASSGRVVGEARIGSASDAEHEFAVTVAEDARGAGVGTALLEGLRSQARSQGVVELRAVVRIDNTPMLALLRRIGAALVRVSDGEVVADIASDGLMPGWPTGPGPARSRVLVEAPGLTERPVTTALRAAGYDVRQCPGPGRGRLEPCPILAMGRCRLADQADLIVCLLPEEDPEGTAVAEAHARDRPSRLAASAPVEHVHSQSAGTV